MSASVIECFHFWCCRHGSEDKLVTITGVMQALVSVVQDSGDILRCLVAGDHQFVFLVREHLILVAIAHTGESQHQLLLQLTYVYNQVRFRSLSQAT